MTRVITYARVSGDDQAKKGTSLPEQARTLRKYVQTHGMELVEHITDPGRTGGNLQRPGMDRVRELVARGDIDVVIATHGDRVSRNHIDSLNLMSEFAGHGCAIRVITEGTDTSTLFGQFQNGLTSLMAQHWRVAGPAGPQAEPSPALRDPHPRSHPRGRHGPVDTEDPGPDGEISQPSAATTWLQTSSGRPAGAVSKASSRAAFEPSHDITLPDATTWAARFDQPGIPHQSGASI